MNVLFLTLFSEIGGSSRIRVFQFLPFLKQAGIGADVKVIFCDRFFKVQGGFVKINKIIKEIYFLSYLVWSVLKRLYFILSAKKYDVVFIQKDVIPKSIYWLLRKINPRVVFEFDDAIYEINPFLRRNSLNYPILCYQANLFYNMVRKAVWVIAENEYLAEEARKYNKNVSIISAPIDVDVFCPSLETSNSGIITIGWIGSPSPSYMLKDIESIFVELTKRHQNIQLKMVGTPPDFSIAGIKVIKKDWRLDEELADLQSFDIGLMPLDDDPRNRGRLGYKMIQYMSVGIPVVASNMGLNKAVIKDGVNGFLVSSEEEWVEKLSLLIENEDLRRQLGQNGRKMAEESFSLEKLAKVFINAIEEAKQ